MGIFVTAVGCIKLFLVLAVCYFTGAVLFAHRAERNSIGLAIVWFVAGFCLISFFFLLSKVIGSGTIAFTLLTSLIVAIWLLRKPEFRLKVEWRVSETGWALALIVLCSLPVLIMGMRMGAGEYPAEFFAADSPFFLQQVYALIRTDSYPPPSLETYGFSFKYHYGVQAFVALSSILTNLKPHFVMFAVVEPLLAVLAGLLVYDICRRLTGRHSTALVCLLLVLLGLKQHFINYLDPSWWRVVTFYEMFNFRYPNVPDLAGLLLSLCAVRCVLEFDRRNMRLAALFFVCMLPVFKISYLIQISVGLALIYCYQMLRQFRLHLLLEIAGVTIASTLIFFLFSQSTGTTDGVAEFKMLGFVTMSMPWQNETIWILFCLVMITAMVTRHGLSEGTSKLLMFAIVPYLLFSLWSFANSNSYQIFELATKLAALFTAVYFVSAWFAGNRMFAPQFVIGAVIVFALISPGAVSLINHIYIVTIHPEQGHEYADNRSVADALGHIPVENTLIVTNDLRYPANHYSRDYRQFQLAGIFGHQNFASNLVYGFRREDMIRYAELLRLFQARTWDATLIGSIKEKFSITHLLIHKNYMHADYIPLNIVYENKDYVVYQF